MPENDGNRPLALIERTLHEIWRQEFGIDRIAVTRTLESLGADDPARARICRAVAQRFGSEMTAEHLLREPTIAGMAMALRGDAAPGQAKSLIRMQRGREGGPVLVCFHPLGGSVAVYSGLSRMLGRGVTVYGVQAIGLVDGQDPDRELLAMGHRYASEIAASLPEAGAVFLGYSMGGLLALEAARFRAAGSAGAAPAAAPEVVMVDTDTQRAPEPSPLAAYRTLVELALGIDFDLGTLAGLGRQEAMTRIRDAAAAQRRLPPNFGVERLCRVADVCEANEAAAHGWSATGRYPSRVHVIHGPADGRDDWTVEAEETVTHRVSGGHDSLLTGAGLEEVADAVRRVLRLE